MFDVLVVDDNMTYDSRVKITSLLRDVEIHFL